ncbi:MAG TPA: outer membrane beta-barrel protein [Bacteroidales bacterium]|nr:outer membrane beta-barrel protein [Bacteroidales bacterium]
MKNLNFFVLAILFFSFEISNSQTLKIQFGRDWSKLKWPTDGEYSDFKTSLNGNILFLGVDYFNGKYFNLSSNLGYLQRQGGKSYDKFIDDQHTTLVKSETSIDQLSLNIKFIIKYPVMERLTPFISIGPTYDYLISQSHKEDRITNIKSGIFGLILGGGAYYNISRFQIGLNIDYYIYLSNFGDLDSRPSPGMTGFLKSEDINARTLISSITLGYRIQ